MIEQLAMLDNLRAADTAFFDHYVESEGDLFDELSSLLGDALLASYLLALDQLAENEYTNLETPEFTDPVRLSFDLPPEAALDYFRSKKVVTSKKFDDLTQQARAGAFTVGGVYKDDLLRGFKNEITKALETGTTQRDTVKRFRDILAGAGHQELGAFHLETVFRTNMQLAYGTGRRRRLEEVAPDLPFWTYHAVLDDRTRPHHRALDGLTLPANDSFWDEHFPPWGFNCRCSVTPTSALPEGYDPYSPSGEALLVYDDNAMPIKAEYGTSVIDLSVSQFTGVPLQGTLQEVIEQAAKRARQAKRATPQAVLDYEERIAFRNYESGAVFDFDGNLITRAKGRKGEVEFTFRSDEIARAVGGYMTHNQDPPGKFSTDDPRRWGYSFSSADIETAANLQLAEIRAVTYGYTFSMKPPRRGWNTKFYREQILPLFERTRLEVYADFDEKLMDGVITWEEFEAEFDHELWKRIAKRLGMRYKRDQR